MSTGIVSTIRSLSSVLLSRAKFARVAGQTFEGKRDLYTELGYKWELTSKDYRQRYERDGVAAAVIEAYPKATWKGHVELIDDEDPTVKTKFEDAWKRFDKRLHFWSILRRADIASGIGRYAVILIGAPGEMSQPLEKLGSLDEVAYLTVFAEDDAAITLWDEDVESERFGQPVTYGLNRAVPDSRRSATERNVHWTRVVHLADNVLDDRVYGMPRLERVWNRLDDLDKLTGGGAESYWLQARPGYQMDVDPSLKLEKGNVEDMEDQITEYEHRLRRWLQTVGVKINPLTATPTSFRNDVDAIISQISAATGIPKRILMGSEAGRLASDQDRQNWFDRVDDRRQNYAESFIVRTFVDKLIELGAEQPIDDEYSIRWSELESTNEKTRIENVGTLADANSKMNGKLILADEIRERFLDLPPFEDVSGIDPLSDLIDDDDDDDDEVNDELNAMDVDDDTRAAMKHKLTIAEKKSLRLLRRRRAVNHGLTSTLRLIDTGTGTRGR